ncbi:family 1 glycosylhydrolase [Embleya sp. NPDC020886]|uniref:family 1 glycosylhydrolase n=1 Tax=Embleya sp. NPDC020886 TaxID=3363980 RepID=UPI00379B98C2
MTRPGDRDFPTDFLWGASTAAHQVEGGQSANDWIDWENAGRTAEVSGPGIAQWERWPTDIALLAELGHNAHRLSIEWSRLAPAPGVWDTAAFDHYARVLDALGEHGLTAFVTLHHFTLPRWFAARGGWLAADAAEVFGAFAAEAGRRLGDRIPFACTVNEPQIVAFNGYLKGNHPPGHRDRTECVAVNDTLMRAHDAAVTALRATAPGTRAGVCLQLPFIQPADPDSLRDAELADWFRDVLIRRHLEHLRDTADPGDWVGVQYYTRARADAAADTELGNAPPGTPSTQMGWEVYPGGLTEMLRQAGQVTGLPIYVTENGIATADDTERVAYLDSHLRAVRAARADGVDVRGYLHWSAFDNFEWTHGYRPRFGLIGIDRDDDLRRIVHPSARAYRRVIRTGRIDALHESDARSESNALHEDDARRESDVLCAGDAEADPRTDTASGVPVNSGPAAGQSKSKEKPMMIDPPVRRLLERVAAGAQPESADLNVRRAQSAATMTLVKFPYDPDVEVTEHRVPVTEGTIAVRVLRPRQPETPVPAYFFLHGGGWVLGNLDTAEAECGPVAALVPCAVVHVDYRLAPEHPFPTPLEDCLAAYAWLLEHAEELGIDATRVAIGGASAGGNLAAAMCLALRERGLPQPSLQVLDAAAVDLTPMAEEPVVPGAPRTPGLSPAEFNVFARHYLADTGDANDPLASPLHGADLSGLAPALILVAEYDPLRDQAEEYLARLRAADVPAAGLRVLGHLHGGWVVPATVTNTLINEMRAAALRHAFAGTLIGPLPPALLDRLAETKPAADVAESASTPA